MVPILGPDPPKREKDEPKRAIRSFKEPKSCIFKKVVFAGDCLHFFTLEASQESLKRPKKAPKRHPKRSKTPKKEIQNWTQKLTNFGSILGFKMGFKSIPQNYSKKNQKIEPKQTCYYMACHLKFNFQCLKKPLLAPILEPHLEARFAQEATR